MTVRARRMGDHGTPARTLPGWVFGLLALGTGACVRQVDPCPPGLEVLQSEDRCVSIEEARSRDAPSPDAEPGDRTDAGDGGEANGTRDDASMPDAADGADRAPDAEPQDAASDGDLAASCSAQDVLAWRSLHQHPMLTSTLGRCSALGCQPGACASLACVSEAAGLSACSACAWAEASCTLSLCSGACSALREQRQCLACVCEAGCVAAFEACAGEALDLCSDLWGSEPGPDEGALVEPLLFRGKSGTGGLRVTPLALPADQDLPITVEHHTSTGFTHLTSFVLGEQAYLLQHKRSCGGDPCLARIYPVLRDGAFARPAYVADWTRGWDETEIVYLAGAPYLVRYKSGASSAEDEPAGQLRIEALSLEEGRVRLRALLDQPWLADTGKPWSGIESFARDGAVYLLAYASDAETQLRFFRVDPGEAGLVLHAAGGARWSGGWDLLETFALEEGRWFLWAHKSGRSYARGEPAGQVRIVSLISDGAGQPSLTPALYEATWKPGLTHAVGYRHEGRGYLVVHDAGQGDTSVYGLGQDPARWSTELGQPVHAEDWGFRPPWDTLEVVRSESW